MRTALFLLSLIALSGPAQADEFSVQIHSEQPFGRFVGDLVRAHVDVRGSENATLISASLPHPGPLTVSLDLRDVSAEEIDEIGGKFWRIDLTYQNFYVALDVRNIEIPGFTFEVFSSGWRHGRQRPRLALRRRAASRNRARTEGKRRGLFASRPCR